MLGSAKPRRLAQPVAVSLEELIPHDYFYRHLETRLELGSVLASAPVTEPDPLCFEDLGCRVGSVRHNLVEFAPLIALPPRRDHLHAP